MRLNPLIAELGTYPFAKLDEVKAAATARGIDLIDFGVGEPREETPQFLRDALCDGIEPLAPYPKATGLPELRAEICRWAERRSGIERDPDRDVIPTLGAKEAIFHMAQVAGGDAIAVTTPGYPVAARGARFAGKDVIELPLDEANGWLLEPERLDQDLLSKTGVLWINTPGNPTGAITPIEQLAEIAERCRAADVLLACDEAYSELWFEGPRPASALELEDLTNVVVVGSLSKRSAMAGHRSGFMLGDPALIAALKTFRPTVGVAPQLNVQQASVAAWADEDHVEVLRERYRAKRSVVMPALTAAGLQNAGGHGSFFLWLKVPAGATDEEFAARLIETCGVVVAPGSFFGPQGSGYVRAALVPTLAECEQAAERLAAEFS